MQRRTGPLFSAAGVVAAWLWMWACVCFCAPSAHAVVPTWTRQLLVTAFGTDAVSNFSNSAGGGVSCVVGLSAVKVNWTASMAMLRLATACTLGADSNVSVCNTSSFCKQLASASQLLLTPLSSTSDRVLTDDLAVALTCNAVVCGLDQAGFYPAAFQIALASVTSGPVLASNLTFTAKTLCVFANNMRLCNDADLKLAFDGTTQVSNTTTLPPSSASAPPTTTVAGAGMVTTTSLPPSSTTTATSNGDSVISPLPLTHQPNPTATSIGTTGEPAAKPPPLIANPLLSNVTDTCTNASVCASAFSLNTTDSHGLHLLCVRACTTTVTCLLASCKSGFTLVAGSICQCVPGSVFNNSRVFQALQPPRCNSSVVSEVQATRNVTYACTALETALSIIGPTYTAKWLRRALGQLQSMPKDIVIANTTNLGNLDRIFKTIVPPLNGSLRIENNTNLTNASTLIASFHAAQATLTVRDNPGLCVPAVLTACYAVATGSSIAFNSSQCGVSCPFHSPRPDGLCSTDFITTLCAFPTVVSSGALKALRNCTVMCGMHLDAAAVDDVALGALQAVTTIVGDLVVSNNPALVALDFLSSLKMVTGGLVFFNNPQLVSAHLDDLTVCTTPPCSIMIAQNPNLCASQLPPGLAKMQGAVISDLSATCGALSLSISLRMEGSNIRRQLSSSSFIDDFFNRTIGAPHGSVRVVQSTDLQPPSPSNSTAPSSQGQSMSSSHPLRRRRSVTDTLMVELVLQGMAYAALSALTASLNSTFASTWLNMTGFSLTTELASSTVSFAIFDLQAQRLASGTALLQWRAPALPFSSFQVQYRAKPSPPLSLQTALVDTLRQSFQTIDASSLLAEATLIASTVVDWLDAASVPFTGPDANYSSLVAALNTQALYEFRILGFTNSTIRISETVRASMYNDGILTEVTFEESSGGVLMTINTAGSSVATVGFTFQVELTQPFDAGVIMGGSGTRSQPADYQTTSANVTVLIPFCPADSSLALLNIIQAAAPCVVSFTHWTVRVLSFTASGDYGLASASAVTTSEGVPDPPTNVTVRLTSATTVNVTFRTPALPRGFVRFYRVLLTSTSSNRTDMGVSDNPSADDVKNRVTKTLFVSISDLQPGTTYSVRVFAATTAGSSLSSDQASVTTSAAASSASSADSTMAVAVGAGVGAVALIVVAALLAMLLLARRRQDKQGVLAWTPPPPDRWEVSRGSLVLGDKLGSGAFGFVNKAVCKGLPNRKGAVTVAVKQCTDTSATSMTSFLDEANLMKRFAEQNPYVLSLLGVCTQSLPLFVIVEFMANGDLRHFLRKHTTLDPSVPPLTPTQLAQMCHEIASGMAFLSINNYVHRDLACRNCLVAEDGTVKIADFGLSRDVEESEYYRKSGEALMPVRWMAPECLLQALFTTESDAWSFGVTVWEIYAGGIMPYPNQTNQEVFQVACHGAKRMGQPVGCPDAIYRMMMQCWSADPTARPSFTTMAYELRMLVARITRGEHGDDLACSQPVNFREGSILSGVPSSSSFEEMVVGDDSRYKQVDSRLPSTLPSRRGSKLSQMSFAAAPILPGAAALLEEEEDEYDPDVISERPCHYLDVAERGPCDTIVSTNLGSDVFFSSASPATAPANAACNNKKGKGKKKAKESKALSRSPSNNGQYLRYGGADNKFSQAHANPPVPVGLYAMPPTQDSEVALTSLGRTPSNSGQYVPYGGADNKFSQLNLSRASPPVPGGLYALPPSQESEFVLSSLADLVKPN